MHLRPKEVHRLHMSITPQPTAASPTTHFVPKGGCRREMCHGRRQTCSSSTPSTSQTVAYGQDALLCGFKQIHVVCSTTQYVVV